MTTMLVKADLVKAVPPQFKSAITESLVDMINNVTTDQIAAEEIRNNFITYTAVLKEGKYKMQDYLNAVQYVSYKQMGMSNRDAYFKTFPDRQAQLIGRGATDKDISSYVSAYHKGKLVNSIMEQVLVPSWILNQDLFQRALNTQAKIMDDEDVNPRDRVAAANSLLTHLSKPKDAITNINLDLRENSGLTELKNTLEQMAKKQQELIVGGVSTKDIAGATLVREDEDITDV